MALIGLAPAQAEADKIYWRDADGVQSADLSIANPLPEVLVTGQAGTARFGEIALDIARSQMYWVSSIDLRRAALDGTGVTNVVVGDASAPRFLKGIALDLVRDDIYLTHIGPSSAASILRTDINGPNFDSVKGVQLAPNGIEFDADNDVLYWAREDGTTTSDRPGSIQRMNRDGTGETTLIDNLGKPVDVALDLIRNKIYWTDVGTNKILRANLDGSGAVEDVISTDLIFPQGIVLDLEHDKVYWSDGTRNVIERANLDGTGREVVLSGLNQPSGIAIDFRGDLFLVPEPASWILLGFAAIWLVLVRKRGVLRFVTVCQAKG